VLSTVQLATKLDFHINYGNIMTRGISYNYVLCLRKHIAGRSVKAEGPHFPYLCFKAQWLLYVPPGVTFKNPTFYPHSAFIGVVTDLQPDGDNKHADLLSSM
jgi:hypothetical protein